MKDLTTIREDIDAIDQKIVQLYEERMALTEQVAEYKQSVGKPVYDKERENAKLTALTSMAKEEFMAKGVRELFTQIMTNSRNRQYQLLAEKGFCGETEFREVEHIQVSDRAIVYQGVEGAYSQQAMRAFFGEDCDDRSFHVETWKDAMEAIQNGSAQYAVLPIENSSAGIVNENYDLLIEYENPIVGEQIIAIDHALLGIPGAKMQDIRRVYSHPQALMQCGRFLEQHRDWQKVSMKNTALSAKKVQEDHKPNQAAIAGEINASLYGLEVLKQEIQNNQHNFTRFIIVTGEKIYSKNAKKISLCFEIPHESGSLYRILGHFIYNGLNMTNIQSRPIGNRPWEYRFFLDFEGKLNEAAVQAALKGLKEETLTMKILGTT